MNKKQITIHRSAGSFCPETLDVEARTVEVVFTTGQAGRRYDWNTDTDYIEELEVTPKAVRTRRLDKGLSVIDSHDIHKGIAGVFGVTEGYRFHDDSLIGTVRFSRDDESDIVFSKVRDGILRHVSLSYRVYKYLKTSGEKDNIDTLRAIDWEPTELSFVPVSFEDNNGVRAGQRNNETTFEVEIIEGREMPSVKEEVQNEERSAPKIDAESVQNERKIDVQNERKIDVQNERKIDVQSVQNETRELLKPMLDIVKRVGLDESFATEAFTTGRSLDEFRGMVIDKMAENQKTTNIKPIFNSDNRLDQKENIREAVENAILLRCGNRDVKLTDPVRRFNGLTLMETARQFLSDVGLNVNMMSRQKLAERAFHTTSDFPLILANVMNKNLQAGYVETPQTFVDLGRRTTVTDFRDKNTYSLGDAPNLLPLGEHGEYKAGTFSENGEKYSIATYARKIGFTRKMLINDDMGALDRLPTMFGQAGSRLESDIVWGLLLNWNFFTNTASNVLMSDGKALFHADHGNLLTGAGSALSETSLTNMRKLGRKQKTVDGNFMNVTYDNLVVPEDLETTAEKLLYLNFTPTTSTDTNPFLNKLQSRVEPRLGAVSAASWLAFSRMVDTFEYAYLAGEEAMYTEINTQADIDGMEILARKDFGAGLIDYRGMAKANGA